MDSTIAGSMNAPNLLNNSLEGRICWLYAKTTLTAYGQEIDDHWLFKFSLHI
jgi:hypothetical protein